MTTIRPYRMSIPIKLYKVRFVQYFDGNWETEPIFEPELIAALLEFDATIDTNTVSVKFPSEYQMALFRLKFA